MTSTGGSKSEEKSNGSVSLSSENALIIESVDSICRDSVDMQYIIQKNSQNLKNSKFYDNLPFIFKCFYN